MISPDALNAWRTTHPWADDDQVEQDLVMTRVAVEIASHPDLRDRLTERFTGPTTAGDPRTLVNRWIRWSDRHLDLHFARIAHDDAPSKRKARAIAYIEHRLSSGDQQCPVHELDESTWRRCLNHLSAHRCPNHGTIDDPEADAPNT